MTEKIVFVCNYSVWCNGDKPCEKCPYLKEMKIVDLNATEGDVVKEVDGACNCS